MVENVFSNIFDVKKDFEFFRKEYFDEQNLREELIKKSRGIVVLSKKVIYNVHRKDFSSAESFLSDLNSKVFSFVDSFKKNNVSFEKFGFFKTTIQEYVEAKSFFEFVKNKRLLLKEEFYDFEVYLLGLLDFSGEVLRIAVNNAVSDKDFFLFCYNTIIFLYDEFMLFDFSNSVLRKKFDSLKYVVKKLEDIKLELDLKEC